MRWFHYPEDDPRYKRGKRRQELADKKFGEFKTDFDRMMAMPEGREKAAEFKKLTEAKPG